MRNTINFNDITWIDILSPNEEDLMLLQEFNLRPEVLKQFIPPVKRPKMEKDTDSFFVVLHFPVYSVAKRTVISVEIDFVLYKNTLITGHHEEVPALKEFMERCAKEEDFKKYRFQSGPHLLLFIIDFLTDECMPMLDTINDEIDKIEKEVFDGKEKEMLFEIATIKRNIIDFRRAIQPQKKVLEILERAAIISHERIGQLGQEVIASNIKIWNALQNNKELIEAIEETNNSLFQAKTSDTVKVLTVISFITFPLSVVSSVFGMNIFDNSFFMKHPNAFFYIIGFMLFVAATMTFFFKRKRWL